MLKIFLFVASFGSLVTGNPFNFEPPSIVQSYQNGVKSSSPSKPPLLLWKARNGINSGLLEDEVATGYRLPNDSIPLRYDLWLKTDVEKEVFEFSGSVKIHIKIVEPTQQITLHYRQIVIDNVDLLTAAKAVVKSNLTFDFEPTFEFLRVYLPDAMSQNDEIILDISYRGELLDNGAGFYRANYTRTDGEVVWYATTQFEMTDARRAMPCYDEPGIRAVTGLKIQHVSSYNAISNMPVDRVDTVDGTDYVTTTFKDTLPMQTYLLAFVISDFDYISDENKIVEQRIYAKPESIANGHAEFALSVVGLVLLKLEEHFNISYPLPKMDHAAITEFVYGAMENFGLITYQEDSLLYDPETSSDEYTKQQIIEIVAHEYAHQYFGNIVAPQWWSYTWLNEGFATLYQYYIPSLIWPETNHMGSFNGLQLFTFFFDSPGSKPLNFYVETPGDIVKKFDIISYQKGGCVLRMFQEALTVPAFTKGVNYYLIDMYLKMAAPIDLHRNLQKAYDEVFPGNNLNIASVMETWEDQAGYPEVNVAHSGDKFILTQSRAGGGSEIYVIPISYAAKSSPRFETKSAQMWMDSKTAEIANVVNDGWIIVNLENTGYYRVAYDNKILSEIVKTLTEAHETIPFVHRNQIVSDITSRYVSESIEISVALNMLKYLTREARYSVWSNAMRVTSDLFVRLFGTISEDAFHELIKSMVQPNLDRLGYEEIEGESVDDYGMRLELINLNCRAYNEECLQRELAKLLLRIESGGVASNFCYGMRLANATIHALMLNEMFAERESNRFEYRVSLGCTLDPVLIRNYIEVALDSSNNLSSYERSNVLELTLHQSVVAYETTFQFIQEHYKEIAEL